MENKQFDVDTIVKFINNVIELTQYDKIKWNPIYPNYDESKFSQLPLCIRYNGEWNGNRLILISRDNNFNFEVRFKNDPDTADVAEELPLRTKNEVQQCLGELYALITNRYKICSNFNELFLNANIEVRFLAKN